MEEKKYYIISIKHTSTNSDNFVLWKPRFCGYTNNVDKAGIYTATEIREHYKDPQGEYFPILEKHIALISDKIDDILVPADDIDALEKLGLTVKRVLTYK